MEKGIINNVGQIYDYIDVLKKFNRDLLTNSFFIDKRIENTIHNQEMYYEYETRCYLNLLCKNDGFYRLYFYIADLNNYFFDGKDVPVVCDIFTVNEDRVFNELRGKLYDSQFYEYANFHKWTLESQTVFLSEPTEQLVFESGHGEEVLELLFGIFDKYTDYLPQKSEVELFLEEKRFFNMYEIKTHRIIGSVVYTVKGRVFTTEYYFVQPEERGKGMSYILLDKYYQTFIDKADKFVSWINEANSSSIAVHRRQKYKKEPLMKSTFVNGKYMS